MMKKIILSLAICFSLFIPMAIYAQTSNSTPAPVNGTQTSAGLSTVSLDNPLGTTNTPQALIGRAISAILGLVGSLALIMFIYGGFLWMTSAGNEKKVSQGRDILMWSTIGLIVIFSSYALVKFVLSDFLGV